MYAGDHNPPHFRVLTGNGKAFMVRLDDLQILAGQANPRAFALAVPGLSIIATCSPHDGPISMVDDGDIVVGAPLPRISAISAREGFRVAVKWESAGHPGRTQAVDLAPAIFRYKIYSPLRDDPDLFRSVHVTDDGFAVAWKGDDLDMASTTIADLAEQAMTPADFAGFMKRSGYTLDSVAAELGISRRLAAYYAKEREIPRHIALACRYLERENSSRVA